MQGFHQRRAGHSFEPLLDFRAQLHRRTCPVTGHQSPCRLLRLSPRDDRGPPRAAETPDPRITHQMVLKVDNLEMSSKPSQLAMRGKASQPSRPAPQRRKQNGAPARSKRYSHSADPLTPTASTNPTPGGRRFQRKFSPTNSRDTAGPTRPPFSPLTGCTTISRATGDDLTNVNYENQPDRSGMAPKTMRLVERVRTLYRKDT